MPAVILGNAQAASCPRTIVDVDACGRLRRVPILEAMVPSEFPLNRLGWEAFEGLCGSILSEILGQTYEVYSPTNDAGRDGGFRGRWTPQGGEAMEGAFTVQCKHVSGERRSIRTSDLKAEVPKVERLVRNGSADVYIVLTNCNVTARAEERLRDIFTDAGVKYFKIFGATWIERTIRESGRLRALVPRLYGLGDLSEILDERVYKQTKALLRAMQDDLAKFVPTDAYRRAVTSIEDHGFVLLVGEPAAGKTTIAHMLSLVASDRWQCQAMEIENVRDLRASWNPDSSSQLFIVDDVFGATQYQRDKAEAWNQTAGHMAAAVRHGARVVVTSRNYIYERARDDLKKGAFPLLGEGEVVVDVEALSESERQRILYNHIKLGDQPHTFKSAIKRFLPAVASHPRFQPEIARRLGTRAFTGNMLMATASVTRFVAQPMEFLRETIGSLSLQDRRALAFLFVSGGSISSPVRVSNAEPALVRLGIDQSALSGSLQSLRGSFVTLQANEDGRDWTYRHPTIQDAMSTLVRDDEELLDVYIAGASLMTLLGEVVCGVRHVGGASIDVPPSLYPDMIGKLREGLEARPRDWLAAIHREHSIYSFLSDRCSKRFLRQFLKAIPDFADRLVQVGPYLDTVSEPPLVAVLARHGLLNDAQRANFIASIKELAVDIPDSGWLEVEAIRTMLTENERGELLQHVRKYVAAQIDDRLWDFLHGPSFNDDDDQIAHYRQVQSTLTAYQEAFEGTGDREAVDRLSDAINSIDESIDEIESSRERRDEPPSREVQPSGNVAVPAGRDIFADVDL